jgi:hypothetical protein
MTLDDYKPLVITDPHSSNLLCTICGGTIRIMIDARVADEKELLHNLTVHFQTHASNPDYN